MLKKRCYEFPSYHLIPSHWALVDQIVPETNLCMRWWPVLVLILMLIYYKKILLNNYFILMITSNEQAHTTQQQLTQGRAEEVPSSTDPSNVPICRWGRVLWHGRGRRRRGCWKVSNCTLFTEGKRASAADTSAWRCLIPLKISSFFTLFPSHQFLAAYMEY
jgi:hypothetical protein